METERESWRQKDRGGAGRWRQRETEMQRDKEDGERERGRVSRPPGSPSSSLSISTFQPKGAFLTPALTLESQVLHSVSRK